MACGRPVAASAVGGMLDVVTDGFDGMLLPTRDDHAWVGVLHQMLMDPEARQQLGSTARQTILGRFTTDQELKAILSVYEGLPS
jgi:glycosyltransferase involved in cell wall biosynthesis